MKTAADGQGSNYLSNGAVQPTSCEDLRNPPFSQPSGYYLIKDTINGKLAAVWCDMSLALADNQNTIGYVDVKTIPSGVHFFGFRTSGYSTVGALIQYGGGGSTGGGFNYTTGVFKVPVTGLYSFSFTARAGSDATKVDLLFNGDLRASSYGELAGDSMVIQYTYSWGKGAEIGIRLTSGSTYEDTNSRYTQFTGFLAEETLPLL